jgi:hypothetical protein
MRDVWGHPEATPGLRGLRDQGILLQERILEMTLKERLQILLITLTIAVGMFAVIDLIIIGGYILWRGL